MRRFERTFSQIWQVFSGEAAWQTVADLARLHRVQASPGYRQAAHLVQDRLATAGLQVEVLSFPADESTHFWAWPSFQEWDCAEAQLHLIEPQAEAQRLADFRSCPISLIQRSTSFDGEADVILLEDGVEATDYEGRDVAGKVILTRGDLRRVYELGVEQRGAVGILSDRMPTVAPVRPEGDLADVRLYTSFWWQPGDRKCFGFVLTPRQGQALRRLLKQPATVVRVRSRVVSRLYDGAIEVVSASIPKETSQQEIVVVAHLCHPQPSANDNASGAAAALEAARTLHTLITQGELPRPRRTIRFLWLPEMTGTVAYLSAHEAELDRLVAGINLDMVGEDQGQTGSSWLIERPPEAAASFASELLAQLRGEYLKVKGMPDVAPSHTGLGEFPLYRLAETAFSGGSDHFILSDPSVGVPTPMLIQWPDRFYHTSADTPDRTDPRSLARAGTLAAAYAYWLAAAGLEEVTELGYDMVARAKARLVETVQVTAGQAMAPESGEALADSLEALHRRVAFLLERQKVALATLERLAPVKGLVADLQAEVEGAAQHELAWARGALDRRAAVLGLPGLPHPRSHERSAEEEQAALRVPVRQVRGPIPLSDHLRRLSEEEREAWRKLQARTDRSAYTMTTLALYWADGVRSVLDIADRVELETGTRDLELVSSYFQLLATLGLVAWR